MSVYLLLKFFHVLGATVLVGTGAGIAFFMLLASRSGDPRLMAGTARLVVIADWVFTAPAVLLQFVTGIGLMEVTGYAYGSAWFLAALALFLFIGACWLPVVAIQYRLRRIAEAMIDGAPNEALHLWMRRWVALGIPAFCAILLLLWLMVTKPLPVV